MLAQLLRAREISTCMRCRRVCVQGVNAVKDFHVLSSPRKPHAASLASCARSLRFHCKIQDHSRRCSRKLTSPFPAPGIMPEPGASVSIIGCFRLGQGITSVFSATKDTAQAISPQQATAFFDDPISRVSLALIPSPASSFGSPLLLMH